MTDEQFRALKQMLLDQNVTIAELSLTIRTMQKRVEELVAQQSEGIVPLAISDELNELFAPYQNRSPSK